MGGVFSLCCDSVNVKDPLFGITTAVDLDLVEEFGPKSRKNHAYELMNIACEVNIFNEKYKSDLKNIIANKGNKGNETNKDIHLDI